MAVAVLLTFVFAAQAQAFSVPAAQIDIEPSPDGYTVTSSDGSGTNLAVMICGDDDVRIFRGAVFASRYSDCRLSAPPGGLDPINDCSTGTCQVVDSSAMVPVGSNNKLHFDLGDQPDRIVIASWSAPSGSDPTLQIDGGNGATSVLDLGGGVRAESPAGLNVNELRQNSELVLSALVDETGFGEPTRALDGSMWPLMPDSTDYCGYESVGLPEFVYASFDRCDHVQTNQTGLVFADSYFGRTLANVFANQQSSVGAYGLVLDGSEPTPNTVVSGSGGGTYSYEFRNTPVAVSLNTSADDGAAGEADLVPDGFEVRTGAGDDTVLGGSGDDLIATGRGSDAVSGGSGDDTLALRNCYCNEPTETGSDSFDGGPGKDSITAPQRWELTGDLGVSLQLGDGNGSSLGLLATTDVERLVAGGGSSNLTDGGDFYDYRLGAGDDTLTLTGLGSDLNDFVGSQPTDGVGHVRKSYTVDLGLGSDMIQGSSASADERIIGDYDSQLDPLHGQLRDTVATNSGSDTYIGQTGLGGSTHRQYFDGGAGSDGMIAASRDAVSATQNGPSDWPNAFLGGSGDDSFTARTGSSATYVAAGDGDFSGSGTTGNDVFSASEGEVGISTFEGADGVSVGNVDGQINTGDGNDSVTSSTGFFDTHTEAIDTGAGDDFVESFGNSSDEVTLGDGDDIVQSGPAGCDSTRPRGSDIFDGGDGEDQVQHQNSSGTAEGDLGGQITRTVGTTVELDQYPAMEVFTAVAEGCSTTGSPTQSPGYGATLTTGGNFHYISTGNQDDTVTLDGRQFSELGGLGIPTTARRHYVVITGGGSDTVYTNARSSGEQVSTDFGSTALSGNDRVIDQLVPEAEINRELVSVSLGGGNDQAQLDYGKRSEIHGGAGSDSIQGIDSQSGADEFVGDEIHGEEGEDSIDGRAGEDWVDGGEESDQISGGTGRDLLFGGDGNDQLLGSDGNDDLSGNDGDDNINGGLGNDLLSGNDGQDTLLGAAGNDRYIADPTPDGSDAITDTAGGDTADYSARTTDVSVDPNDPGDDGASGEGDAIPREVENLISGSGQDTLVVSRARSGSLRSGAGNDTLYTNSSHADAVDCGGDDDTLYRDRYDTPPGRSNCEQNIFGELVTNQSLPSISVDTSTAPTALPRSSTVPVGSEISLSTGTWDGEPAPAVSGQWQRCDLSLAHCADFLGASGVYTTTADDRGSRIRARLTATNIFGSFTTYTAATDPIAAVGQQVTTDVPVTLLPTPTNTDGGGGSPGSGGGGGEEPTCNADLTKRPLRSRTLRVMRGVKAQIQLRTADTTGHPSKPRLEAGQRLIAELGFVGDARRERYQRSKFARYASSLVLRVPGSKAIVLRADRSTGRWQTRLTTSQQLLGRVRPRLEVRLRGSNRPSRNTGNTRAKRRFQIVFTASCQRSKR